MRIYTQNQILNVFGYIPESISSFLSETGVKIEKVGLESDSITHYLKKGIKKRGYEVVGMESRRMAAILASIIILFLNFRISPALAEA